MIEVSGMDVEEVVRENRRMKETIEVVKTVAFFAGAYLGICLLGMAMASKRNAAKAYEDGLRTGGEVAYDKGFDRGYDKGYDSAHAEISHG